MPTETPTKPKQHTFYYQFLHCSRSFSVAVLKSEEEIPENVRDGVIERLGSGAKIIWPLNPSEEEVEKLERNTLCPKCKEARVSFIWPMAG